MCVVVDEMESEGVSRLVLRLTPFEMFHSAKDSGRHIVQSSEDRGNSWRFFLFYRFLYFIHGIPGISTVKLLEGA